MVLTFIGLIHPGGTVYSSELETLPSVTFAFFPSSILAFATQQGNIHSLDLRSSREPFTLNIRPELGYLTDMEVGKDKNWIVAGTSRGYVGLWDVRYQTMVKLWRHSGDSPIKRLSDAFGNSPDDQSQPLVFMDVTTMRHHSLMYQMVHVFNAIEY